MPHTDGSSRADDGGGRSLAARRVLVVAAAACFATTGTAQALGPDGASPVAVGAARVLVGALGLLAVTLWSARRAGGRPGLRVPRSWAVGWGAAGVAGYQASFFLAVRTTGVAVGTVVALGSAPVITGVLGWALHGRRTSRRWALATGIAVTGLAVLTGGKPTDGVSPVGVGLALLAGLSYAVYTLAAKALIERGCPPEQAVTWVFGAGALLSLPLLAVGGAAWMATSGGIAMIGWLGVVATTLAYVLFARGLQGLPAAEVSTLTLAEPVGASLLGVVILAERLGVTGIAGVALIVAALAALVGAPPGRAQAGRAQVRRAQARRAQARRAPNQPAEDR